GRGVVCGVSADYAVAFAGGAFRGECVSLAFGDSQFADIVFGGNLSAGGGSVRECGEMDGREHVVHVQGLYFAGGTGVADGAAGVGPGAALHETICEPEFSAADV